MVALVNAPQLTLYVNNTNTNKDDKLALLLLCRFYYSFTPWTIIMVYNLQPSAKFELEPGCDYKFSTDWGGSCTYECHSPLFRGPTK